MDYIFGIPLGKQRTGSNEVVTVMSVTVIYSIIEFMKTTVEYV